MLYIHNDKGRKPIEKTMNYHVILRPIFYKRAHNSSETHKNERFYYQKSSKSGLNHSGSPVLLYILLSLTRHLNMERSGRGRSWIGTRMSNLWHSPISKFIIYTSTIDINRVFFMSISSISFLNERKTCKKLSQQSTKTTTILWQLSSIQIFNINRIIALKKWRTKQKITGWPCHSGFFGGTKEYTFWLLQTLPILSQCS